MENLDLWTATIVSTLFEAFVCIYLVFAWVTYRRQIRGIGLFICGVTGVTLANFLTSQTEWHFVLNNMLSILCFIGGLWLVVLAFEMFFLGKGRRSTWVSGLILVTSVLFARAFFFFVMPVASVRFVWTSLMALVPFLFLVNVFSMRTSEYKLPAGLLLGASVFQALVAAIRIPIYLTNVITPDYFDLGWTQSLITIAWNIGFTAFPFGFALLIADEQRRRISTQDREKTVLLRELYHRTKNNLQSLIGLLELKKDMDDGPANAKLQDMQDKMQAMAMVHEELSKSQDLASIDFGSFCRTYLDRHSIEADLLVPERSIALTLEFAMPLGLVLEEVLQLAATGPQQRLAVRLEETAEDSLSLQVSGFRRGFREGEDNATDPSTGIPFVRLIAEEQLGGTVRVEEQGIHIKVPRGRH